MRYVKTRFIEDQRELAYRIYISDSLQTISKGTGDGTYITKRYWDIYQDMVKPKKEETKEELLARFKRNGIIK